MAKSKTHTFVIKVHFDKKCTATHALREVRDTIHGEFYTSEIEDGAPGAYKVKRIGHLPAAARVQA